MRAPDRYHVLVVEDEYFVADDLSHALVDSGVQVVATVPTAGDALAWLAHATVDCVLLDINLRGRMSFPLARRLRADGVPFAFLTGYDTVGEADLADVQLLAKPFVLAEVLDAIGRAPRGTPAGTALTDA